MVTSTQSRPDEICGNCFAVWRAQKPRPLAVRCWHKDMVARPTPNGWKIMKHPSDRDLTAMREEGLL